MSVIAAPFSLQSSQQVGEPKRFLVTGSSGFVGGKLKFALQQTFPDCVIFDLGGFAGQGRLEEPADLIAAAKLKPDVTFHLAALSSVGQSFDGALGTVRANLGGTMALGEAIRAHAPGSTFVFASSGEAYGASFVGGQSLDENAPLQPNTPYARTKAAGEWALRDILSDVCPVIVLRLFNHTGAGQDARFVLPSFAQQIAQIEAGMITPIIKVGNLSAERDFLHVDDVIDAYLAIATASSPATNGHDTYNVCSGQARSIKSLLDGMLAHAQVPVQIEIDPSRLRPSDIPRAVGNNDKFKAQWNWQPTRHIDTLLQDVLEYARAQQRSSA